jgi:TonB-dependent receptor
VSQIGAQTFSFNTGSNGTPTPTTGEPLTWSPTSTSGATGRGTITNTPNHQLFEQFADTTNLTYRYDDGRWKLETGLSRSAATSQRHNLAAGFFQQAAATNKNPIRINFLDITADKPSRIEVFDNSYQPVDWHDILNYRGTTALNLDLNLRRQDLNGYLNLRRRFELFPFPTALQVGGSQRVQFVDNSTQQVAWTFMGPDGVSGTTAPMQPYVMQVYKNMDSHYGFYGITFMSPSRAWQAYLLNPKLYAKTVAQEFTEENYRLDNSEYIEEKVQAAYVQAEATLFRSRLRVLGGVRFEKTTDDGQGALTNADAVWLRDASGAYVRTAAGARIRRPEAGAVNSLEQIKLTRQERGTFAHRSYDGYYPSLHLTFSATENLLVRAAYAGTYGRPDYTDIIPRTVATSADLDDDDPTPSTGRGMLTIRNPTLKPWTADNFDLSVEYYTQSGGVLSGGVFRKNIRNFFGDSSRIADANLLNELGLDQQYLNWNVVTKFNSGDATINGAEFNVRQSLRGLGKWGSYFTLFANATKLDLDGGPGASFSSFVPESGNWGGTFSGKRLTVTARWNYRGRDRRLPQAAFGPDGYEYFEPRLTLDMNAAYQLSRRLSLNAGVNNLTNTPQRFLRYGSNTPAYARQYQISKFAIPLAVGLRGTF